MSFNDIAKMFKEAADYCFDDSITKPQADIFEKWDWAVAMEFTKSICNLLRENGVKIMCSKYPLGAKEIKDGIELCSDFEIDSLDFSEHDKPFEDEIKALKGECARLREELASAKGLNEEIIEFSTNPIAMATNLIDAFYDSLEKGEVTPALEEISGHLLVYCMHNPEE